MGDTMEIFDGGIGWEESNPNKEDELQKWQLLDRPLMLCVIGVIA